MRSKLIIAFVLFAGWVPAKDGMGQEPDAIYQLLSKEYRLNDDGSMELRYRKELRLLTHYAFHSRYGETFVVYDPRYQRLQINEAYTVMADGKKVVTPANAFNEVLPRFAANFPAYNSLREMVITHTGLEVGAVIHLDYTLVTAAGYLPALMAKETLVISSPVEQQTITVDIPESSELFHKTLHIRAAPEITRANGRNRYVWKFPALPARTSEPFLPNDASYLPTILFSTATSLYGSLDWMSSQQAFRSGVNESIKPGTDSLADPLKKMLEIQKLVVEELNLFEIPLEYTGYRIRTPEEIWLSNGGTEAEKCIMMCSLLNKAGIPAVPCAVIPQELLDRSIGCLQAIKGFVVEAHSAAYGKLYLSPVRLNAQNLTYDLSGCALVHVDPEAESLYIVEVPDQMGTVNTNMHLTIDTSLQLTGTVTAEIGQTLNPFFGITRDENLIKGMFTSFAGAACIRSFTTETLAPGQLSGVWDLNCEKAMREQDGYYFLELPAYKDGFNSWQMAYLNANRTSPISIPSLIEETYTLTLELPDNLALINNPCSVKLSNNAGSLLVEIFHKKKTVHVSRNLHITRKIIDPETYNDLRVLITEWNNMNNRTIFLKEAK